MIADEDETQPPELGKRPLFTQMDVLVHFSDNKYGWKQISRYVMLYNQPPALSGMEISGSLRAAR